MSAISDEEKDLRSGDSSMKEESLDSVEMEALSPEEGDGWTEEFSADEAANPTAFVPGSARSADEGRAEEIGSEEIDFYRREARSLSAHQPERAALMYLEAAAAAERAGSESDQVVADVELALALRPDSSWLLPSVRRLLLRQGRWERVLEISRREVERGGENATRAGVLWQAASVVQSQQQDARASLALIEKALLLQPGDVLALCSAVALKAELGLHAQLADSLEQLGFSLGVAEERGLYLYAAGTIRETLLNQIEQAEADYRRAIEADPQHRPALMALCALYERKGAWLQLCSSLEDLARLAPSKGIEARLLAQAGSLHLDCTGDLEAAARDLGRSVQAAPHDPTSLQRLAYAHEARGRMQELYQTQRQLLDLTLEAQGRAALLTHMGQLLETRLNDVEGAIRAYREALANLEGYLPALQSLSMLYRHRGDYENLLEIYQPEVEGTLPAQTRAVRCVEMGEIFAAKLNRSEEAARSYRRALELDPGLHLAFWGLCRILRELGAHEEQVELLVTQAARSGDKKTRNQLSLEAGRLLAGPLGEKDRAIELLRSIPERDESRTIAAELLELYQTNETLPELVALLLEQSEETKDAAEAQGRRLQAAHVLELSLDEPQRALEIYKQVLVLDPRCVAALHGTGRIYHRLGLWNELVKLYYHELVSDPDRPDAPILLCRIGRILEEHLGQTSAAIKAYAKALEKDPSCAPALPALERLVRSERRWEDLVQVLKRYASARKSGIAAADALCRAAEVADYQLRDLDRATQLYREARAIYPESSLARHGLLRVYRRKDNWDGAVEILRELIATCDSDEERSQFQLELARIKEYFLREAPDLVLYQAAADGTSFGHRLRAELTRVLRLTRAPGLATWLHDLGRSTTADSALAAAQLLESAILREPIDVSTSLDPARLAYARQPRSVSAIWTLERVLFKNRCWSELAELFEKEAQLELDPVIRGGELSAAAQTFLRAGKFEEAGRVARECLTLDDQCSMALLVLARVAERDRRSAELAVLCERLAAVSDDAGNRLRFRLKAADLWSEGAGEPGRALATLAAALAEQPDEPQAFAHAERLLRAAHKFEELSRMYRRRIKASVDDETRVELLRQHARLLRDDLKDEGQAITQLSELLVLYPSDLQALAELSELLMRLKHWSDAAAKLGLLAEKAMDPEVRHRARLDRAKIWLRQLHDPQQAHEILTAALEERPADLEAKKLMVDLCSTEGNWPEARRILESVAAEEDLEVQMWAIIQLAELAWLGLRDESLRRRYELDALRRAMREPGLLPLLIEHYRESRELARLIEMGERILETQEEDAGAGELRLALAQLLLEDLHQAERSVRHLEICLRDSPGQRLALDLSARGYERLGRFEEAAGQYRALLSGDVLSVEGYRGLARLASRAGRHETEAAVAALIDLIGEADPEETALLKGLEGVMTPAGRVDLATMPLPKELERLQQILKLVAPFLHEVYPTHLPDVLPSGHPVMVASQRLSEALDLGEIIVSLSAAVGAEAGPGDPVPLLIAPTLAETPGNAAFRFWVGRALCTAATSGVLLERLSEEELADFVLALTEERTASSTVQALRKQLGKALPRKIRKQLEAMQSSTDVSLWRKYRAEEERRADRVGLLMSRNVRDGLLQLAGALKLGEGELTRSLRIVGLMRYAISDEFAEGLRSLWS
jgi:golgin subfamily B member 1